VVERASDIIITINKEGESVAAGASVQKGRLPTKAARAMFQVGLYARSTLRWLTSSPISI
jgi:hypothetical protein